MTETIRPRRSVLYVPGSNTRALEKARALAADAVILDLEDSVAPDIKVGARQQVADTLAQGGFGHREVAVRCNAPSTDAGAADLAMIARSGADAVLIPKVSVPADLETVRDALSSHGAPGSLSLWIMIETPLAILNAGAIAGAASHGAHPLTAFVLGTNDLAKETRAEQIPGRASMLTWLSMAVVAARAYGLDVIDGVYNAFQDIKGFEEECRQGRSLGMDGKTVIHPSQIAIANTIFSPSAGEVAAAEQIVAAYAQPENQGKGAITLDGRMVELLHRDMAWRTLALHQAITRAFSS